MKISKLFIAAVLFIATSNAFAQDTEKDSHSLKLGVPQVALLDIESTVAKAISLKATAPTEAGEKVEFNQSNSDLWLNYSSIVGNESSRAITVQITDGDVPSGIDLTVSANKYEGDGEGTMGEIAEKSIVLNNKKATNIIKGIGSAYTGNGAKNGHNLTYRITQSEDKDAYANLNFDESTTLTITYTLSDN
ncbi:hypothetical protein SAMN05444411_101651 [Lutibacter oricola]|uniref:Uncharacterized protein n=1 Tax=Lutibacter oricola TaxID=762486 RepID=A0A1H2T987_9FLAO|nr:hypothetical protein [Lutibacter oricola]SDW40400.1 hypothetical protein SAMN05444411_101651 [Lutibacter oricola]